MRFEYDPKVDALYIVLAEGASAESVDVRPGVTIDLDETGKLLGIEILNVKQTVAVGVEMPVAAE